MKKKVFKILSSIGQEGNFEDLVNEHLADGWEFHGPMICFLGGSSIMYKQAVIKEIEEEDEEEERTSVMHWLDEDEEIEEVTKETLESFKNIYERNKDKAIVRLKDVIERLDCLDVPPTIGCVVSYGDNEKRSINGVCSYRGWYQCLSLDVRDDSTTTLKLDKLLDELKAAVGEVYGGYKGGLYRMCEETPVYISHYKQSDKYMIGSIEVENDKVIINAVEVE